MAQNVALQTTRLPALVLKLQRDLALTEKDAILADSIVTEYRAKPGAIAILVQTYGLTIAEVGEVYNARDRVNAGLGSGLGSSQQTISLKQLVLFQQRFKSVATDGEALAVQVLELHERFQDKYLSHILEKLAEMSTRQPNALPEALADFLEGQMEFGSLDDKEE